MQNNLYSEIVQKVFGDGQSEESKESEVSYGYRNDSNANDCKCG